MNTYRKRSSKSRQRLGALAWLVTGLAIPTQAGLFNSNFNEDPSGILSVLGTAKWVDSGGVNNSGYVSLTDAINDQQGTILIDDLDGGTPVAGLLATFKLRMGGGSGNAADGFSFNFATDLSGSTFSEEGQGTGITVVFDIYDNGGGEAPAIDVKAGGVVVRSKLIAKADILTGNDFVDVRIEYRNGLLDVSFKGQLVHQGVVMGLGPLSGARTALGARTGGENNNNWIDDLRIETFAATQPSISGTRGTAQGFRVHLTDAPNAAVNPATVAATFDGAPATGTATKSGDVTTFAFAGPTRLEANSTHPVVLTYKYGAAAVTATQSFVVTVPPYAVIPANLALPASSIDTSKRGFVWQVHQVDSATALATTKARAEDQLIGKLGGNVADPSISGAADDVAAAPNPTTAPIEFKISGVINLSQSEGTLLGNVTPDLQMPGVPGLMGGTDSVAAAVLTALEFPAAGTYTMIVNSDDGFETTLGRNPSDVFATRLGIFEGGRGAANTVFDFYVEAPGLYAVRTLWYEGGGDANIELLVEMADGQRVLVNDTGTHPQAIKAYQLPITAVPAYVQSLSPASGSTAIRETTSVEAMIFDAGTQVITSGITMKLNGSDVPVTATKTAGRTRVVYGAGLLSNTPYTAELTYSDNVGPRTVTWSFRSGLIGEPIFVVEGEDFDYGGGQANPQAGTTGLDVNVMPYLGGAYAGLDAVKGIDYSNADGNDSDLYRTETDDNGENEVNIVARDNIAAGNGLGGTLPINSSDRVTYSTTANFAIGWVGGGDWVNLTRTFPSNGRGGWWKVYAGLSYGGADAGQLNGNLVRVTAGHGTAEQTTEALGQFGAPGSGGWGNNNLVEMKTASGATAVVKLTGKQTIRFNMSSGDLDFLIFSATAAPPPMVQTVPQDSGTRTNAVLDWVIADTDSKVNPASVRVNYAGQDVTSQAVVTKTATGATVRLDLSGSMQPAGEFPWTLNFSDDGSPIQSVQATGIYVVVPYPTPGIFSIEGEDFNYSDDGVTGGKSNPQAGTPDMDVNVMPYLGGAYEGLSAVKGVDYNNADANDSDFYRTELDANGENEVNIASSNGNRYSNDRGGFVTTSNFRIGWVASGDWQNYTRTFPQGSFNVWAAMSFDGRAAGQLNGSLVRVTSDPTKPDQTTEPLGTFNAPGSAGWGRNELVPMKNGTGAIASVALNGAQTIRFNLASGDLDYLVLVPASGAAPEITQITRNTNGSITIQWTGGGTLQSATSVDGPWTDMPSATSPHTFTVTGPLFFGRIRQ